MGHGQSGHEHGATSVKLSFSIVALIVVILGGACQTPVEAAIARVGALMANDACASTSSTNSLACTTNATLEAGNYALWFVALDNTQTTDVTSGECNATASDSASNSYSKVGEFTNGQGGAAAGATICVYSGLASAQLASGGTLTFGFANSIVSKAANGEEYTVGANLQLAGSLQTLASDSATDPASLAISGLSSASRLYCRFLAHERNTAANWTASTSFTATNMSKADTGTAATSMAVRGECRVNTSTGETSDPTMATSATDQASIMFALEEIVTRRPIAPIIFQ